DVNARESEWGQTPLIFAAAADRPAAITALLKHGADASIRTKSINLNEQAAQEQAANRRRTEVFVSFQPKQVRDSIAAANASAAAAGSTGGAAAGGQQVGGAGGGAGGGFGGGAGGGGGRGGPQVSTEKLTPAQIQEAIEAGRKVLTAPPTRPATEEADTTDGQVAGFAGTVGSMGGMTPLLHAVRQGNMASVIALLDGGADI